MPRPIVLATALVLLTTCLLTTDLTAHGERIVPALDECRVAPRHLPTVDMTEPSRAANTAPDAEPFVLPPGAPVTEVTRATLTTAVRELVACENAGDAARLAALHSDAFLRHHGDTLAARTELGVKGEETALLAIDDVRSLADGRVGMLVHLDRASDPRPEVAAYLVFTAADGRWLLDDLLEESASTPALAAAATLRDVTGTQIGTVNLTQTFGGRVEVTMRLDGAPVGGHAVHIHESGTCDLGPEPELFAAAGGIFNPAQAAHPGQAGNLGNIGTDVTGYGELYASPNQVTLSPGPTSLLDADGSVVVLHAGMDDAMTEPEGTSGARIACGVITLVSPVAAGHGGITLREHWITGMTALGIGGFLTWRLAPARRRRRARQRRRVKQARPPQPQNALVKDP